MMPEFGLKMWSTNSDLLVHAKELIREKVFDYVELTPVPDTDIEAFSESGLPFVVHATTERWGFNISDPKKIELNRSLLDRSIEVADELSSPFIIVHPGFGDFSAAREFLSEYHDKRILIESMPMRGLGGETLTCHTAESIEELMDNRFGLCLDLNHTIKAAISLKKSPESLIEEFINVGPSMFHIADGSLTIEVDEHLNLGVGEYDMSSLADVLKKSCPTKVTLETPRASPDDDRMNSRFLKNLLSND